MSVKPEVDVLVCTVICRRTAYVLDLFLDNQQGIQRVYPGCCLIMATDEPDFASELKERIGTTLTSDVIVYKTVKPDYAKSHLWSIACGRETLRRYMLSSEAKFILFLDGDMTFDTAIIDILKRKIQRADVVLNGYMDHVGTNWAYGPGCMLIKRGLLSKIDFRCYEFKNGQVIEEGSSLDTGLFPNRSRVIRGIFVASKHFRSHEECSFISPQPVDWFRKIVNNSLMRYLLIKISILFNYNISDYLHEHLSLRFWNKHSTI